MTRYGGSPRCAEKGTPARNLVRAAPQRQLSHERIDFRGAGESLLARAVSLMFPMGVQPRQQTNWRAPQRVRPA
jgi:hypothetical protein